MFWIALGATAGVLVVRKLTRAAESLTPEGAAGQVSKTFGSVSASIREFADDVRASMAERDTELRHALGIDENGESGPADLAALDDLAHNYQRRGTH
nr:DUF6167 family protein [Phytoactinopolyspora alkaliphila]